MKRGALEPEAHDGPPSARRLEAAYHAHVADLIARYAPVLSAAEVDALVIHSGSPIKRTEYDDQYWPLRPTPHFQHWLPLAQPDCALVVVPGKKPVLAWLKSTSYWENPPDPESRHFERALDVHTVTDIDAIRALVPSGRVAFVGALALVALAGCAAPLAPSAFDASTPPMRPETFFDGTTRSTGVLQDPSGAPTRRLRVAGHGAALPDGSFRLDQTVTLADAPAETRTWVMRRVDAHRYAATLTDASGPVDGEAYGNVFHWTFTAILTPGNPLAHVQMSQWMYLQPDGRTMINRDTITKAGLIVAEATEQLHDDMA